MRVTLVRIDSETTHGWQVRWGYKSTGKRRHRQGDHAPRYRSKLFSDAVHGGNKGALREAQKMIRQVGGPSKPAARKPARNVARPAKSARTAKKVRK
jgi:hypothetical protein